MKTLTILLFFLIASSSTFGQSPNRPVILEGTIVSTTLDLKFDNAVDRRMPDAEKLVVKIELYLRLKNEGTVPLLVLDPARCFCDKTIEFFTEIAFISAGETPVLRTMQNDEPWRGRPRDRFDSDPFAGYLGTLDRRDPESAPILLIEPGRTHEFRDTITIEDGYKVEWRAGKTRRDFQKEIPIPDYPAFRVEYRLSTKGRPKYVSLFADLRDRWKRFGNFFISGADEIVLRSDPIVNIPSR